MWSVFVTTCATYIRLIKIVFPIFPNASFSFGIIYNFVDWMLSSPTRDAPCHRRSIQVRFRVKSIPYLGFRMNGNNSWTLCDKVSAYMPLLPGRTSLYKTCIHHASEYIGSLLDLLKKFTLESLAGSNDLHSRFVYLKTALSSAPVLRFPTSPLPFVLHANASCYDFPHPISCASKKLLGR